MIDNDRSLPQKKRKKEIHVLVNEINQITSSAILAKLAKLSTNALSHRYYAQYADNILKSHFPSFHCTVDYSFGPIIFQSN